MTMNLWVPPAVLQNLLSSVLWARSLLAAHWNGPAADRPRNAYCCLFCCETYCGPITAASGIRRCDLYLRCPVLRRSTKKARQSRALGRASLGTITISRVGGPAGILPSGLRVAGSRRARSTAVRQKPSPRESRSLMQFRIAMLA